MLRGTTRKGEPKVAELYPERLEKDRGPLNTDQAGDVTGQGVRPCSSNFKFSILIYEYCFTWQSYAKFMLPKTPVFSLFTTDYTRQFGILMALGKDDDFNGPRTHTKIYLFGPFYRPMTRFRSRNFD